jgi:hypothetical protein
MVRMRASVSKYQHALRPQRSDEELLRRALSSGHTLTSLLASFREPDPTRFFFGSGEASAIARDLDRVAPGWTERTVDAGDRLRTRVVRLLGADEVHLEATATGPGKLPWHRDMLNDYSWNPHAFYKQIKIPHGRADIKVPWELSRCQHLPTLGMAYVATGDSDYAGEIVTQIDDWIVANSPGYGVNWACTMDVAIRAVNWLWAYHFVLDAPQATDAFLVRLLASLLCHGRHIARNIEKYEHGITTNHTLADYVGLLYLGLLLPELADASDWVSNGYDGVLSCMRAQVAADGVDYENSIPYHRLVLEMFAGSYVLAERNKLSFPDDYHRSLERMFVFVQHYTRPDGLAPLVGDSDDGRLQILSRYFDWHPQDHRYLLAVGAALFGRDDLAASVHGTPDAGEEAAWLLGSGVLDSISVRRTGRGLLTSKAFGPSGRYVMRHREHHAVVCADEVGTAGKGNHKHNDIFSYELSVGGVSMIVDPGSYLYTSDPSSRNLFRSTNAHNTVVIDGAEQNEFAGDFGMKANARVQVIQWRSDAVCDVFDASHTGYCRLREPVTHRRTIVFSKDPFAWLVVDGIVGSGEHLVESCVHLAPGGKLAANAPSPGPHIELTTARLAGMLDMDEHLNVRREQGVVFARDGVQIVIVPLNCGPFVVDRGWFAPRYGQRVQCDVLRLSARLPCPVAVGYLIVPERTSAWN